MPIPMSLICRDSLVYCHDLLGGFVLAHDPASSLFFFFFFSSRRRHTRCSRDWSSDVCSSDLHVLDPRHLDRVQDVVEVGVEVVGFPGGQERPHLAHPDHTAAVGQGTRSEEHTSELQSRLHLVCRLLLEKKKKTQHTQNIQRQ